MTYSYKFVLIVLALFVTACAAQSNVTIYEEGPQHFSGYMCTPHAPYTIEDSYSALLDGMLNSPGESHLRAAEKERLHNFITECRFFDHPQFNAAWMAKQERNFAFLYNHYGDQKAPAIWRELNALYYTHNRSR